MLIVPSFQDAIKAANLFSLFFQFNLKLDWGEEQAPYVRRLGHEVVDTNSWELQLRP